MLKNILILLFLISSLTINSISFANSKDNHDSSILGTWKLISLTDINSNTKQQSFPYGKKPQGYLNYLSNGYMSVIIVGNNRSKEASQSYHPMTSYAGTYTIKNNMVTHHILVAWNPKWIGTDKIRYFKIKNNYLTLTILNPSTTGAFLSVLVWERVKT